MKRTSISIIACLVAMNVVMPASANGLLGGLLGGGSDAGSGGGLGETLNDVVSSVVTVNDTSNDGLVNIDTGTTTGGGGDLSVSVGGGGAVEPVGTISVGTSDTSGLSVTASVPEVVTADVNVGGSGGAVSADVGILNDTVTANVGVATPSTPASGGTSTGGGLVVANVGLGTPAPTSTGGGLVSVNVGLGTPAPTSTGGGLINVNVGAPNIATLPTTPTTPPSPGTSAPGTPSLADLPILRVSVTNGRVTSTVVTPGRVSAQPAEAPAVLARVVAPVSRGVANGSDQCVGESENKLSGLIASTNVSASDWQSASNVSVQRVAICGDTQRWLQAELQNSGIGRQLESATSADALISASLSRADFSNERVFAVQKRGSSLIVYVY